MRTSMSTTNRAARKLQTLSVGVLACLLGAGCGGKTADRAGVSGKVTFDGQPVAAGQVVFEPQGAGRMGIAQIVDGAYTMPPEQGPTAGEYVVRITANRPTGAKAAAGRGSDEQVDVYEQFIPAKYNDQTELKAQVGNEAAVVQDFALTSK
jgi:hypothetical protein